MKPHPITDKVLEAQRAALKEHVPAGMSIADQRRINRELLWHALFAMACLDPHVNMVTVAADTRSAIIEGVKAGQAMGNHKL